MRVINEKSEWNQIIYQFPFWDVAHEWGYFRAFHLRDSSFEPILFYYKENDYQVAYPFFKRKLALHGDYPEATDDQYYLTAPYGYSGPLYDSQTEDAKNWEPFKNAFEKYCLENKIHLIEERFHPVFNNQFPLLPQSNLYLQREVIVVEPEEPEELFNNYQKKSIRTQIRKAREAGMVVKEEGEETIASFLQMYGDTMDRNHANEIYYFDEPFLRTLAEEFKERLVFINAYLEDELIASLMYLYSPHCAFGFLGALNYEYRNLGTNTYLNHMAYAYFHEQEIPYCNVGGGRTKEMDDPLLSFKKGFMSKKNNGKELRKYYNSKTICERSINE